MGFSRVIIIVIDACGVGALPDAEQFGDTGAATIPHTAAAVGGLNLPALEEMGLGNIAQIDGVSPTPQAIGAFGRMAAKANGKDSTTGHWEIAGVQLDQPFPTFPDGFPDDLVHAFEERTGLTVIGNKPASGTEIIKELGERHLESGDIILYTSADSVFQLAAHESKIPVDQLYAHCEIARELCKGPYAVGRVIARPFTGEPGYFVRTSRRRDFSIEPPRKTVLDLLSENNHPVFSIGKIWDLFAGRGIDNKVKTADNNEVMDALRQTVRYDHQHRLVFANCVDFDQTWGHRRNPKGFARALEEFDVRLQEILPLLGETDLLIITADHGCDPTFTAHTDHTREYVPLLVYSKLARQALDLGTRETFSDLACTIAENFNLTHDFPGTSFLRELIP